MANQIVVSAGAKVRNLSGVLTATSGVVSFLPIDVSMGIPQLDVNGKILVSQLPNSVMEYKGTWSAATNTPTLVNGTGNQGDVYLCNVAGTVNFGAGAIAFFVGDQVIYSGSIWQRASGATGTVTSVAVTETGDSLNITGSPITTSGTINIGFNGTNLQYVNGAGNLTTFPILTGYVPYTGATQDVDLGAFSLNGKSLHIKGTAGNGHLGLKHQSAAATGSANESLIYADSLGDLSWQNANLYLSKFITSANSANRSYTFPNATCNIPDDSLVVHLAGTETITGAKTFSGYTTFTSTVDITSGLTFSNSGFTLVLQPPTLSVNRTVTLPNGTGTLALTSDLTGYLTAVTATSPLSSSGGTTPNITIAQATTSANGYLSSTDWNTFNNKQATITLTTTGTSGAATLIGATLNIPNYAPDLSGYVTLAGTQTITGAKTFSTYSKFDGGVILKNNVSASLAGYVGLSAYSASGNKGINIDFDTYSASFYFSGTLPYQYTFPAANGTIALVGGSGVGTVTSVAALTIGTTGTDLSSTVANSTTTPVITLNVPTASATNRGALASADWTTFNNKQDALTNPVTGTGTTNYLPKFTGASTIGNSNLINDASGNLGLGVTPSAWNTVTAFQVGNGSIYAYGNEIGLQSNAYYSSGWKYVSNGGASEYMQYQGVHSWYTAPSGTAGAAITFTQAMTLNASGNLLLGTASDPAYGRTTASIYNSTGGILQIAGSSTTALFYVYQPDNIAVIGTTTNHSFAIHTNATQRLLISNTGAATFSSSVTAQTGEFISGGQDGATGSVVRISSTNALARNWGIVNTWDNYGDLTFRVSNAAGGNALSAGSTKMVILSSGNVGIGTSSPSRKLDIRNASGTGAQTIVSVVNTTNDSNTGAFIGFGDAYTDTVSPYVYAARVGGVRDGAGDTGYMSFYTRSAYNSETERMRITSQGALILTNTSNSVLYLKNTATSGKEWNFQSYLDGTLYVGVSGLTYYPLTMTSTGIATFGGLVVFDGASGGTNTYNQLNRSGIGTESMFVWRTAGTAKWYLGQRSKNSEDGFSLYGVAAVDDVLYFAPSGAAKFNYTVTASSFFESSDSRLKTLIQDNYQTKGIESITPKLYTKNGKVELGYYAQDFVGVLDSAVSKGSDDMLSLSYREVLVAKVYALEQRIKELENK